MGPAKEAAVDSALSEAPHKDMTSLLFREETISHTEPDANEHMKREVEDASIGDVGSNKDAAHTHVNGHSSEAPIPPALSDDEAATKSNVSAARVDLAPRSDGGHMGGSITADVVKGDPDKHSNLSLISLTNGHSEGAVNAPKENGHFDDVWSPATKLKRRLEDTKDLIVCPGVYDGFSARIALSVGFDAMYMTGAGTTASRLGMADLGIASRTDMKNHADMIANLDPSKILIADMDTGYGGPITITTTVNQYIRANVAGFHIEDQLLTKRCGHLAGKKVVSQDVYLSRIKAAKAAKDKAHSDIVLIARTDANQQHGYDECLSRLRAARDIGADVGLLEGFKSKEEARRAVQDLAPWPLLLNVVENGHSPLITVDEAREMGFRIMIFSFGALVPAYLAIKNAFERLKTDGVTGVHETKISPRSIFDVCGLEEAMEVDEIAGGEDFKGGV